MGVDVWRSGLDFYFLKYLTLDRGVTKKKTRPDLHCAFKNTSVPECLAQNEGRNFDVL